MTAESSWPYAPSHVFLVLHNPESFENSPNHSGIIVESYLNHSLREAKQGGAWSSRLRLGTVALGCLQALKQFFLLGTLE